MPPKKNSVPPSPDPEDSMPSNRAGVPPYPDPEYAVPSNRVQDSAGVPQSRDPAYTMPSNRAQEAAGVPPSRVPAYTMPSNRAQGSAGIPPSRVPAAPMPSNWDPDRIQMPPPPHPILREREEVWQRWFPNTNTQGFSPAAPQARPQRLGFSGTISDPIDVHANAGGSPRITPNFGPPPYRREPFESLLDPHSFQYLHQQLPRFPNTIPLPGQYSPSHRVQRLLDAAWRVPNMSVRPVAQMYSPPPSPTQASNGATQQTDARSPRLLLGVINGVGHQLDPRSPPVSPCSCHVGVGNGDHQQVNANQNRLPLCLSHGSPNQQVDTRQPHVLHGYKSRSGGASNGVTQQADTNQNRSSPVLPGPRHGSPSNGVYQQANTNQNRSSPTLLGSRDGTRSNGRNQSAGSNQNRPPPQAFVRLPANYATNLQYRQYLYIPALLHHSASLMNSVSRYRESASGFKRRLDEELVTIHNGDIDEEFATTARLLDHWEVVLSVADQKKTYWWDKVLKQADEENKTFEEMWGWCIDENTLANDYTMADSSTEGNQFLDS